MGRGTSLLEAALLGRIPFGCDINPLSATLIRPRLTPPTLEQVAQRLTQVNLESPRDLPEELLVFYHPDTLRQIVNLKDYLITRRNAHQMDHIDEWIAMVALNRLTGHSNGFFSVYTLPPNQAVSVKSQQKINTRRNQSPPPRNVSAIMLKKSRILMRDLNASARHTLAHVSPRAILVTGSADDTPQIPTGSVSLAVTSGPFLDIVQYATDNWLRCWFLGIDSASIKITVPKKIEAWQEKMTAVFHELHRVLKPGGHVAFEVGEVHAGKTRLEEAVLPCGISAGLEPSLVLINDQKFTRPANCWGIDNMSKGTNTNILDPSLAAVRKAVLARDDHLCRIRGPRCRGYATTDHHVIPFSQAPDLFWEPENIVAACGACDCAGGSASPPRTGARSSSGSAPSLSSSNRRSTS